MPKQKFCHLAEDSEGFVIISKWYTLNYIVWKLRPHIWPSDQNYWVINAEWNA